MFQSAFLLALVIKRCNDHIKTFIDSPNGLVQTLQVNNWPQRERAWFGYFVILYHNT